MTPCKELGYKVGDKFEVVGAQGSFSKGSIISLKIDTGTTTPRFELIEGHRIDPFEVSKCHVNSLKPLPNLPTEDFKINLSNMTDIEKSLAKEWLKKVAESRGLGSNYLSDDDEYVVNYVWVDSIYSGDQGLRVKGYNVATDNECYEHEVDLPELSLSFTNPKVKGWELSDNKSEKELQLEQTIDKLQAALEQAEEKSEKELQLEELVGKLQQQLEEAQQKLKEIQ